MPHYTDLYSLPSSSALCLPHYNSGSLNFLNYSKPVTRYPHLYKPHLSTISEISLPYRRLNTPKLYTSDISSRPIKVINTADIDVSVNKYKKYEKKRLKGKESTYTPEPVKEAKPNPGIRRDRATVRLRTVHTDTIKEEIGAFRKWRDNFEPEELTNEKKTTKKTKGEILKEKFLIRSRSKENITALENKKKNPIKKTTSFRDICDAITCDELDEELNPGQPEQVQRRQSKQIATAGLYQEIRRVSAELSPEDLTVLNVMLASQNDSLDSLDDSLTIYESEEAESDIDVGKQIEEDIQTPEEDKQTPEEDIQTPEEDIQTPIKVENEKINENRAKIDNLKKQIEIGKLKQKYNNQLESKNEPRDISNVEIEEIKFKPKPVITSSVEDIVKPKKTLVAVVDEIEEEKSIKKKLKANVNVNIETVKKKESIKKGKVIYPLPEKKLITNIIENTSKKPNNNKELKELKLKKKEEIITKIPKKLFDPKSSILNTMPPKLTSKRSLIQKSIKHDPDLTIFVPPPEPEPEPKPKNDNVFVPLQSNRLSQWMHPFAKPEQYDSCPVEIFAKPKVIKSRHYPRLRKRNNLPSEPVQNSIESDSDDESSTEETSASLRSNDSGFGSTIPEKINDNLLSDNAECEAINNEMEEFLTAVKKCGRIVPPATTIPRFKKYSVDDFDFLKVLGKGSFGKVLLAKIKESEYYYAVKCLKKDAIVEDNDVECTLIERKVLALGTKHPFLCHLLCTFQTETHLFFVMELLNGGDLMFHITTGGCFPEDQARFYSAEVISGIQFLHSKGIIYRDLKLDNIIVDFDGHVRLADFGMCKLEIFLDRMAESFCGTPDYMAPEIIKGQHYNQSVDWWSFGVLLYEMLLGQSPFSGCDEDELFWSICNEKPVLPKHLSTYAVDILTLLLEKDQTKRLGTRFCEHGPIRDHRFYHSIDWSALEARQLEPPFKPILCHPLDTQYFDKNFTKETVKLTTTVTPVPETIDQSQFLGFSYTNPNACDK